MEALRRIDFDKFICSPRLSKIRADRSSSSSSISGNSARRSVRRSSKDHGSYQDSPHVLDGIQEVFMAYTRNISQNIQPLSESFADSSTLFSLIFMNKRPNKWPGSSCENSRKTSSRPFPRWPRRRAGIPIPPRIRRPVSNPLSKPRIRYYLLYFTPFSEAKKGTFRSMKIRVKDRNYTVVNRQGYIY